jgi:hypothetical protein
MNKLMLWKRPNDWFGEYHNDWYVFLQRNRDSDILEQSNFEVAWGKLDKNTSMPPGIVREAHWLCGWVDWIKIHVDDKKNIAIANKIMDDLESHPVLDYDDYNERTWEYVSNYWGESCLVERIDICKSCGESIFFARHEYN